MKGATSVSKMDHKETWHPHNTLILLNIFRKKYIKFEYLNLLDTVLRHSLHMLDEQECFIKTQEYLIWK